jgi:hypothetical protein
MSNSSSLPSLLATFNSVQWSFSYIILPICFVLGNLGTGLNLLIFGRHSSRVSSCLLYFLSASIANIFILNFGLLLRLLRGIWSIDPGVTSLWFCRWRTYLVSILFSIYRCSILLACIDRMCASSRRVGMRAWSQPKVAHRMVVINCVLWFIVYIPNLVFHTIAYGQCLAPPDTTYATYLTIFTLCQGLLIPLGMTVCGIITLSHLKSMQTRVVAVVIGVDQERGVAGQFTIMLLVQVCTDCLCNLLYPCYLIYSLIFPVSQSPQIAAINSFLISMSFTLPYLNYSAAFYLHTLSSPSFRRKLLPLIRRIPYIQQCLPLNNEINTINIIAMNTMRGRGTATLDRSTAGKK